MLVAQGVRRPALEWEPAGDHLEEDDTKGVDVEARTSTDLGSRNCSGGHIGPGTQTERRYRVNRGLEVSTSEMDSLISFATVVMVCGSWVFLVLIFQRNG